MVSRPKYSGGPKLSAKRGERRREQHQRDHADRAGHERADGGDRQRRAGAALARHRVAVDAGHHRRGLARDAHQDRGGRAAVHGAVVDAGQQHDRRGRRQAEGHRQQQADAGERPQPRQHADQGADDAAEHGIGQHRRLQRDREAESEVVQGFDHGAPFLEAPRPERQRHSEQCARTGSSVPADSRSAATSAGSGWLALEAQQQERRQ